LTLAANVRHSIDVHKNHRSAATLGEDEEELKVLFWTDDDCIQSLERTRPNLVSHFKMETEGMYKADICRGTALLEHGGFYLDVDVGVRHDLWHDMRPQTEFVTARVHQASNWVGKGFFQAALGASPQSPILKRYLELFEHHYDGTNRVSKGPLGVLLLKRAWDQVNEELENEKKNTIPTELYQELLFQENGPLDSGDNKGVLSPAPTWGKRRACHFIVAGIANDPSNIEMVLESSNNNSDNDKGNVDTDETKKKEERNHWVANPRSEPNTGKPDVRRRSERDRRHRRWWRGKQEPQHDPNDGVDEVVGANMRTMNDWLVYWLNSWFANDPRKPKRFATKNKSVVEDIPQTFEVNRRNQQATTRLCIPKERFGTAGIRGLSHSKADTTR